MSTDEKQLSSERFGFTVFLSACFHALLILGLGFTYLEELNSEPALEITLAQYRSELEPEQADFLAQENQLGSGVLDEAAAPSTPFDADFNAEQIQEVLPLPQAPVLPEESALENTQVLSTFENEPQIQESLEQVETEADLQPEEQVDQDELSLAIASLQAQLDMRREAYAKRPRKYTISSASTRKSRDALYLDQWRRRVEAVGNINYPEQARRNRIYGSVRMLVVMLPDGSVRDIQILESSGQNLLDQAAVEIISLAAPFEAFPESMRAEVDILEIIRTFRFHEGNALSSY